MDPTKNEIVIKWEAFKTVNVRDLIKKVKKVRDHGLSMLRRLFVNIYVLGKYTKRTTKSRINSNVRCWNIFQP